MSRRSRRWLSSPKPASLSSSPARRGRSSGETPSATFSGLTAPTWSAFLGRRGGDPVWGWVVGIGALNRHLALVGFMGAGKTTVGREVARLTGRPFVDVDEELERRHGPIARIFEERGEPEFRVLEAQLAAEVLGTDEPAVVALGGGAVTMEEIRGFLDLRAFTVWLQVSPDEAWARAGSSNRPLARDEGDFRRLYEERQALYEAV